MNKAICFVLCIITFAFANHKLINAYPYHDDRCSLTWHDTVTFNNGIILYLSAYGISYGCDIYLGFLNDSYILLGYKDTTISDTNWAASIFMPTILFPLDTFTHTDSTNSQAIFIGYHVFVKTGGYYGGYYQDCVGYSPNIFYAKAKDGSNMKFQITNYNYSQGITIVYVTDSLGNGSFSNETTRLRANIINHTGRTSTSSIYVDLRGKLHKKDMLNRFRYLIRKEHLISR